jgi:hypothetical protein
MLKPEQRERLQDCMLFVESAQDTLASVDRGLVPNYEEIEACFESADKALKNALSA